MTLSLSSALVISDGGANLDDRPPLSFSFSSSPLSFREMAATIRDCTRVEAGYSFSLCLQGFSTVIDLLFLHFPPSCLKKIPPDFRSFSDIL